MTAPVSNIPLSIDYTSRDYYSLREDLIDLVKRRVNVDPSREWSGEDPSDFGVALIEAFAYVGDLTNYYIDRIANETYLPTATRRKSVLNLANLYGYTASGFRAAMLQVTFTNTFTLSITDATVANGTTVTYTYQNLSTNPLINVGDVVSIFGIDPVVGGTEEAPTSTPSQFNIPSATVTAVTTTTFTITAGSSVTQTYTDGGEVSKQFTLPAGTQVSGSVLCDDVVEEVIFTTLEEAVIPPVLNGSLGQVLVWAEHGEDVSTRTDNAPQGGNDIAGERVGTSNGLPNQVYVLSENQVVEDTLQVYVQSGDVYEPWTKVTYLTDFGPADAVYSTEMDENNFVYIKFGDGISGSIPSNLSGIKAVYRVGGGTIGNISAGTLNSIEYVPGVTDIGFITSVIEAGNPVSPLREGVGLGGAEPEDNRSIRTNASRALRSGNRAVSLADYGDLALSVQNVGKANAEAEVWSSVTLYVAPVRGVDDTDKFPGFFEDNSRPTTEWDEIASATEEFFRDKTLIGTSLTISPPSYVQATVGVSFIKSDKYTAEQAADDIRRTIVNNFGYVNQEFGAVITPEQIEVQLNSLQSVSTARVKTLKRSTEEGVIRKPLIAGPSEIFIFLGANTTATEESSETRLLTLTAASSGLSPTFNPTVASQLVAVGNVNYIDWYSFSLNGITGVGNVSVTFSATATTGATILVNGLPQSTPVVTLPNTTTTAVISVTAPDQTTVKDYIVYIPR